MAVRKGKWDHITKNLPRDFGEEPSYQDKIDLKKEELRAEENFKQESSWLAREYVDLRREKNAAATVLSDIELELAAMGQLMATQFEADGIKSMKTEDGCSVGVYSEPAAQVTDRAALRTWVIEEGLESQLQLPWATLNSLMKSRLAEGEPEPPGVAVSSRVKFRVEGLGRSHDD